MTSLVVALPGCDRTCAALTEGCAYRIAWSINPHMAIGAADPVRAARQHARFVRTLRHAGAQVVTLPFIHGAYDSMFAKDCAVLTTDACGARALIATPRHAERAVERPHRASQLRLEGFAVDDSLEVALEGGDVVLAAGHAFLGTGFRSARAAAPKLARFLRMPVVPLELVEPRLYHLDMALAVLADGTTLVCEDALSHGSRAAVRALALGEIIPVSRDAAEQFAVNIVELGTTIVTGSPSVEVANALRARGRKVIQVELDEFHKAGGSAACLVSQIHDRREAIAVAA